MNWYLSNGIAVIAVTALIGCDSRERQPHLPNETPNVSNSKQDTGIPTPSSRNTNSIKMEKSNLRTPETIQFLDGSSAKLRPVGSEKVILLYVWTSYAASIHEDIDLLRKAIRKHEADGVNLILINCWESHDEIQQFVTTEKLDYLVAVDPDKKVADKLGIQSVPRLYLIDNQGIARWKRVGPLADVDLESAILDVTSR